MKKNRLLSLTLAFAMVFAMAGCNGSTTATPDATVSQPGSSTEQKSSEIVIKVGQASDVLSFAHIRSTTLTPLLH